MMPIDGAAGNLQISACFVNIMTLSIWTQFANFSPTFHLGRSFSTRFVTDVSRPVISQHEASNVAF